MSEKATVLTVKVSGLVRDRLAHRAAVRGVSVSDEARRALHAHLGIDADEQSITKEMSCPN